MSTIIDQMRDAAAKISATNIGPPDPQVWVASSPAEYERAVRGGIKNVVMLRRLEPHPKEPAKL